MVELADTYSQRENLLREETIRVVTKLEGNVASLPGSLCSLDLQPCPVASVFSCASLPASRELCEDRERVQGPLCPSAPGTRGLKKVAPE